MSAETRRPVFEQIAASILFVGTVVVFLPSTSNGFLAFDDAVYVTDNPQIQAGFTRESVAWAFTSGQGANWFPLTRLSHMLDVELFSDDPRGHHAMSVLLHAINAALVYVVLARLTGARAASFAAGLLFAVHPLHVESVSWISSRKDVLSGLFWLLGMAAYLGYAKRPNIARYALVAVLYTFAFMSKPIAVTFPVILLLFDFWPLARMRQGGGSIGRRELLGLFVEKLPLFVLAVGFSAIAVVAQRAGGTMEEMENVGLAARMNNALVAYVRYIAHTLWPIDLMFPYQHLGEARPMWHAGAAAALLALITVVALLLRNRLPSVIVGWLWFVVMLLPTIGLIQVGTQAMADRYMYLPILGLFLMVVWPAAKFAQLRAVRVPIDEGSIRVGPDAVSLAAALVAVVVFFGVVTWQQQRIWHDSESLLAHAVAIEPNNVPARVQLAVVYLRRGEPTRAEEQLLDALARDGSSVPAWSNLGSALRMQGRADEAVNAFRRALEIDTRQYAPALNLSTLLVEIGRSEEAIPILESILDHRDENGGGYEAIANAYVGEARPHDAARVVNEGLSRFPDNAELQQMAERISDITAIDSVERR